MTVLVTSRHRKVQQRENGYNLGNLEEYTVKVISKHFQTSLESFRNRGYKYYEEKVSEIPNANRYRSIITLKLFSVMTDGLNSQMCSRSILITFQFKLSKRICLFTPAICYFKQKHFLHFSFYFSFYFFLLQQLRVAYRPRHEE